MIGPPRNWMKRIAIAVAVVAITIQWVNTRATMLRVNQNPSHPMVLATYTIFQ